MQEFHDGSFGEPKLIDEVIKDLAGEIKHLKALHIGKAERETTPSPPPPPLPSQDTDVIFRKQFDQFREDFNQLRKDVNAIMIQLGLADRDRVLVVDPDSAPPEYKRRMQALFGEDH